MAKEKILLVDDEPELLNSWRKLLESEGYAVEVAGCGAQAIRILSAEAIGLLLLDLNMPDMNGHEVMEYVKEHELDVSTIVISGETSFEWVSRAFLLGAHDYLQKPFALQELLTILERVQKKRDMERSFQTLRRQLERSERLHRFMIESSPDIIFIVDSQGNFAFVNERARDLLGYGKDELVGRHFSSIVVPEYLERATHWFTERRAGQRATRDAEVWLQCKPGNRRKHFDQDRIAIELNAMGVYEHEDEEEQGLRDFSGTYVVARDITERLANEKLIHYQAYHDLLTGLPNRALFLERLNKAISEARHQRRHLTIMFVDLDRFKMVNDTQGHAVGDRLLQTVSRRLKGCLRESDTLARMGGDEFIVMLPNVESETVAHKVAEKIVLAIKEPFHFDGQELYVTASIGIAMYPRDGDTAEILIKHSDIAMYHTKGQGKNGYYLYSGHMSDWQHQRLNLENDIRRGLREGQFELFYQPQVNTRDCRITGVEALLRWNHPQRGLLPPGEFLSVAEECGLMVELGDWVLHAALSEVQSWRRAGLPVDKLAINFSLAQIEQDNFVDKVIAALRRHDFPGGALEIELTESTLMNDVDSIIAKLRQLHNVGILVAIDDFGTGYSSLSLLQKLPINRLKIDRSFIQGIGEDGDCSIIEAITHMARGLNLEMVAEGVEEASQLRFLMELKCLVVQGYIYSRGLPATEARQLLSAPLEPVLDAGGASSSPG